MGTAILSYSLTGNNEALARQVAKELQADHIRIKESRVRTNGTVVLDMLFRRTPAVHPEPSVLDEYDTVLLFGPVWMGNVASPLRAYLKKIRSADCRYGFFTISGGALGPNAQLEAELIKRAGRAPEHVLDAHIADLMKLGEKPTMKDTSAYRITEEDIQSLTVEVLEALAKSTEDN